VQVGPALPRDVRRGSPVQCDVDQLPLPGAFVFGRYGVRSGGSAALARV